MNALILAAGIGERLRPYTQRIAKPAIPFLNIPIISYPLFYLEQAGLKNLVVNTHHLPDTIEKAVKGILHPASNVMFSHEPDILGSGGGLAQAMELLAEDEDVFVANGDAVALFPAPDILKDLLAMHQKESALATLLVCPFPPARENFGGVYVNINNQVTDFSKTSLNDPSSKPSHFTGFMVVNSRVWRGLAKKPSNLLYDILLPKIKAGGRVMALSQPKSHWFETGNVSDYLTATRTCLELLAAPSWAEITLAQILDRYSSGWRRGFSGAKDGDLGLIGPSQVQNIQVRGFAVAGPQTQIEKNVTLVRSVIGGSVTISAGQTITDQLIL